MLHEEVNKEKNEREPSKERPAAAIRRYHEYKYSGTKGT